MTAVSKLFQQLASEYKNFKLNPSKMKGTYRLNEQYGLRGDADIQTEEWKVYDASTGDLIPWREAPEIFIQDVQIVVSRWNVIKEENGVKDPINTLKEHGFEDAPIVDDSPEETPIDEAEEAVIKAAEEKTRLDENKRTLDMIEQFEQNEVQVKPNTYNAIPEKQGFYTQPEDKLETVPTPKKGEVKLLDIISDLVEDDLVQFYGKTGTAKTSIAIQAALEARKTGKSVYYLDTEKNISRSKREAMKNAGVIYTPYTPSSGEFKTVNDLIALHDFIKKIQKVDLLIVDSLGLPVLSVFCEGNQKDQGLSIQKMIIISKYLKSYANKNGSLVIVINQPESDMNKDPKTIRRSFGDKSEFYFKELLWTSFAEKSENKTTVVVKTYRSRDYGMGHKLFTVEISADGMKVIQ
jgi:RecA/RadA recombinase